jgi:L-serine dehydratase
MESIKSIFKVGYGPSSSHTMAPGKAAEQFRQQTPGASSYHITLYGSLAATGKGHFTDKAVTGALSPHPVEITWEPLTFLPAHPNGIRLQAHAGDGALIKEWTTYSIGGGDLSDTGKREEAGSVYPEYNMKDILAVCRKNGWTFWEYVLAFEEPDLSDYLADIWNQMEESVSRGLDTEGVLPGGLNLPRKASSYFTKAKAFTGTMSRRAFTFAYALAVAEENAAGGQIVTAPTCGSAGVIPAVLHLLHEQYDFSEKKILYGLATAGLIGTLIRTNASISGAEVGCQGEVGSACSMASGAVVQLFGGTPAQVEYAASIGMEHFLGLTCDPVMGLVQIPCIERNAFGAGRALDASMYALLSDGSHLVSFDKVIETMKKTGHDLPSIYKETSAGGLAATF